MNTEDAIRIAELDKELNRVNGELLHLRSWANRLQDILMLIMWRKDTVCWIPCDVKLPDNPHPVLVVVHHKKPYDNYEVTIGEYWGEPEGWGDWEDAEIVSWTGLPPLPEPYKGV